MLSLAEENGSSKIHSKTVGFCWRHCQPGSKKQSPGKIPGRKESTGVGLRLGWFSRHDLPAYISIIIYIYTLYIDTYTACVYRYILCIYFIFFTTYIMCILYVYVYIYIHVLFKYICVMSYIFVYYLQVSTIHTYMITYARFKHNHTYRSTGITFTSIHRGRSFLWDSWSREGCGGDTGG